MSLICSLLKRLNLYAICTYRIRSAPLAHFMLSGLIRHIGSCIHTGMGQLQARHSAVAGKLHRAAYVADAREFKTAVSR